MTVHKTSFSKTKIEITLILLHSEPLPAQSNFMLQCEKKGVRGLGLNTFYKSSSNVLVYYYLRSSTPIESFTSNGFSES